MLCIVDMLLTEINMPGVLKYTYSHVSTYIWEGEFLVSDT